MLGRHHSLGRDWLARKGSVEGQEEALVVPDGDDLDLFAHDAFTDGEALRAQLLREGRSVPRMLIFAGAALCLEESACRGPGQFDEEKLSSAAWKCCHAASLEESVSSTSCAVTAQVRCWRTEAMPDEDVQSCCRRHVSSARASTLRWSRP